MRFIVRARFDNFYFGWLTWLDSTLLPWLSAILISLSARCTRAYEHWNLVTNEHSFYRAIPYRNVMWWFWECYLLLCASCASSGHPMAYDTSISLHWKEREEGSRKMCRTVEVTAEQDFSYSYSPDIDRWEQRFSLYIRQICFKRILKRAAMFWH